MYFCSLCDFKTSRSDAFKRHENTNKHLRALMYNPYHVSENVIPNSENVIPKSENVIPNSENVIPKSENVIPNSENVIHNELKCKYSCKKCGKIYSKKEYLNNHEKTCCGVDTLTCQRCMKTFANRQSKYKHCKRNNCKPISIFEAENVKSIINNNNCQITTNNNSNNTVNNTNVNIYINDYGKERKDYLLDYDNFYDIIRIPNNNILVKYLKCKNFNPNFPENHCIKYENKRFKLKENENWRLINPTALKNKLYHDCGSEVLYVFDKHKEQIKNQIANLEAYEYVKKKSNYIELELEGSDKEIKNKI